MTIKLTGLRELDAALRDMKKSTAKATMKRAAMDALTPMRDTAQALAPVDDGQLRDSIGIAPTLIRSARSKGAKGGDDTTTRVTAYVGTSNRNGVPREFGTVRSGAHPFLRPAFDGTKGQVLNRVADSLRTEIDKAAKRAAKRKAKG